MMHEENQAFMKGVYHGQHTEQTAQSPQKADRKAKSLPSHKLKQLTSGGERHLSPDF